MMKDSAIVIVMIKLRINQLLPTNYRLPTTKNAFTIVELIIVITIMAILITLGVVNLRGTQANARDNERKTDIETIAQHLETYYKGGTDSSPANVDCTGGSISHDGLYTVHTFTATGTSTLTCTTSVTASALIVGGGGGGGAGYQGGGGGAGGVLSPSIPLTAQPYTVVVGNNGNGGYTTSVPTSGVYSSFAGQIAYGGGSGGAEQNVWGLTPAAFSGGSGGGGSHGTSAPALIGGSGTENQGYAGGMGYTGNPYVGGGGGGAGGLGGSATSSAAGNGGVGISKNISGTALLYAGGGGGSLRGGGTSTGGDGGGGGGNGSGAGSNATYYGGGGGAAGGSNGQGGPGGNGYQGIVIVRYLTPIGIGSYPSTAIMATVDALKLALRDIDTNSFIAPGLASSGDDSTTIADHVASTFISATDGTIPTTASTHPTKNEYVYQPLQSGGALCTITAQECRKFNLYYRMETDNTVYMVTSINQ